jgi:hypothetical protein
MASLYIRGSYYWLTFKDGEGKWRQQSTKLRTDIPVEAEQAVKLCEAHSARERGAKLISFIQAALAFTCYG